MDFLRELRLVFVFIGCTRLAGSDYPMDTKFLTLSDGRGYSFDVLRGKILFSTPHKTRRVTNRSSPFKSNTTKFMKNFSFSDLLQRTELEEDIIIDYGVDLSTI